MDIECHERQPGIQSVGDDGEKRAGMNMLRAGLYRGNQDQSR